MIEKLQMAAAKVCDSISAEQATAYQLALEATGALSKSGASCLEIGRLLSGLTLMIASMEKVYGENLRKWEELMQVFSTEQGLLEDFRQTEEGQCLSGLAEKQAFVLQELNGLRQALLVIVDMFPPVE